MKEKFGIVTIVTLLLALLGVVAPITWDYYTGQKELTVTSISQSTIISPIKNVDGLEIQYKNTPLKVLSKSTFSIENTGSKSLLKGDVVSPIEITVGEGISILDAMIDNKIPSNLELDIVRNSNSIMVHFTLLNQGDSATISLLTDSNELSLNATARIVGVDEITLLRSPPKSLTISGVIWTVVLLISGLLIAAAFFGASDIPKEFKVRNMIKSNSLVVPNFESFDDAYSWVEDVLSFTTKSERAPLIRLLARLENSDTGFVQSDIKNEVEIVVNESMSNLKMAIFIFALGAFGVFYSAGTLGLI